MNAKIKTLKEVDDIIKNSLQDRVMIDNDNDNPLVDAYNDGVLAMAGQIRTHLNAMMDCESILEDAKKMGHTVIIERVRED